MVIVYLLVIFTLVYIKNKNYQFQKNNLYAHNILILIKITIYCTSYLRRNGKRINIKNQRHRTAKIQPPLFNND